MKAGDIMIKVQPIPLTRMQSYKVAQEYSCVDFIPVVDDNQRYLGVIAKEALLAQMADTAVDFEERITGQLNHNLLCVLENADICSVAVKTSEAVVVDTEGRVKGIITKDAMISALVTSIKGYREQFESILNATQNGILAIDKDGYIQLSIKPFVKC